MNSVKLDFSKINILSFSYCYIKIDIQEYEKQLEYFMNDNSYYVMNIIFALLE